MTERGLRLLHLSDLHMRGLDGPQADRARREAPFRERVIGEAWARNLAELRAHGPIDLVVFTGDLADWGHPADYPRALAFLAATCAALDVPTSRLFVVPGNHDVDRTIQREAWASLRRDIATDPAAYSAWMAGDQPRGLRADPRRDQVLERQQAFWSAVAGELGRPELGPWRSSHGRLGYRQGVALDGLRQPVHVIGLDSAWLAGDEHDPGELWLTEHQVALLTTDAGRALPGLRIALMHHRLADLADGIAARKLLAGRVDVLLHGHQHEPTADVLSGPDHELLVLAAGCLYEGDAEHRYPNAYQLIELVLDDDARPLRAGVRFRGWSPRNYFWGDDALLYQSAPGGRLPLRRTADGWRFDDAPAEQPPRLPPHAVFVGRSDELARLEAAFAGGAAGRVAIVAVQGMAGIGKTYLAQEFHARHPERFDDYQHVVIDPERPGELASWIAVLGKHAGLDAARASAAAVAEALRGRRTLVHVDNVDSAAAAALVAELADALAGVPMLITGRYAHLGTAAGSGWARIELPPLDAGDALQLLRCELAGAPAGATDAELHELVRQVAGLPLALHLASGYLRRGVTVEQFLARLHRAGLALGPCDPADPVRKERARGVLSESFAISRELLLAPAGGAPTAWAAAAAALGWAPRAGFGRSLGAALLGLDEPGFDDFIDAAVGLSLARRMRPEERAHPGWAVHPLLAEFLRHGSARDPVDERVAIWLACHANPALDDDRAARWEVLSAESAAVSEWLGTASETAIEGVLTVACSFVESRGPIAPWLAAAQRVRRRATTAGTLWVIGQLARRAGQFALATDAASDLARRAHADGDHRIRALARSQIANVMVRGRDPDHALQVNCVIDPWRDVPRWPPAHPPSDAPRYATASASLAETALARLLAPLDEAAAPSSGGASELDEALRIYRDESLPTLERLGDARSHAITLGRVADILVLRGQLDEALQIRRDRELPVYERLGDVRSIAITRGQIADILALRGEHDEALRIRRDDELPVYERLGDERFRGITLGKIADLLVSRDWAAAVSHWRAAEAVLAPLGDARLVAWVRRRLAELEATRP